MWMTPLASTVGFSQSVWKGGNILELFLNVFTEFPEFSDKIFVITVKGLEPLPTSHLLCKRPECYHSTCKTHVRQELNPIYTSMTISFPEFAEFSESYAPFWKNSIKRLPGSLVSERSFIWDATLCCFQGNVVATNAPTLNVPTIKESKAAQLSGKQAPI